jgi:hypothetical protein
LDVIIKHQRRPSIRTEYVIGHITRKVFVLDESAREAIPHGVHELVDHLEGGREGGKEGGREGGKEGEVSVISLTNHQKS